MTRSAMDLDAMDVSEVDDLVLDFGANVKDGEAISAVDISVEVARGKADPGAADMASGSHVVGRVDESGTFIPDGAGLSILQRLDANDRIDRNVYCLRCVVTLTGGRQLAGACHIPVRKL